MVIAQLRTGALVRVFPIFQLGDGIVSIYFFPRTVPLLCVSIPVSSSPVAAPRCIVSTVSKKKQWQWQKVEKWNENINRIASGNKYQETDFDGREMPSSHRYTRTEVIWVEPRTVYRRKMHCKPGREKCISMWRKI